MAEPPSAQNNIDQLIARALASRLVEVRQKLAPVDDQLDKNSRAAEELFDAGLRKIAEGGQYDPSGATAISPEPSPTAFLQQLRQRKDDVAALLKDRYSLPWDIARDSEQAVAEWLLCQLMVAHRPKAERGKLAPPQMEELLLKLNLTAVKAVKSRDPRFIDALNYYYECLPRPVAANDSLSYASFLGIYEMALAQWRRRLGEI